MANGQGARKELYEQLDKVILQWKDEPGGLLPIMQNAQEILGCVDEEVQYAIGLCLGTACYVRGSQLVMDELVKQLGIESGNTTADGLFTLDATRCIGCCGLAPAMMINDDVYGKVTPAEIPGILDKYRQIG